MVSDMVSVLKLSLSPSPIPLSFPFSSARVPGGPGTIVWVDSGFLSAAAAETSSGLRPRG